MAPIGTRFCTTSATNDIKRLQLGEGGEAFVTDIKGRILGHIIVSAMDDALWIDSVPEANEFLVGHLDRYLITEDVQIADRSDEVGPLCLVGPQAADWPEGACHRRNQFAGLGSVLCGVGGSGRSHSPRGLHTTAGASN